MGFKFRKSINLGGGFKINLSQSGVGYSWGIPGIRLSRSANGSVKQTFSIPGTGISYSKTLSSKKKKKNKQEPAQDAQLPAEIIEEKVNNANFENFEPNSNCDEFISKINQFRKVNLLISVLIIVLTILLSVLLLNPLVLVAGVAVFGVYTLYKNLKIRIPVEYDFDEANAQYYENINNLFKEISQTQKLWLIEAISKDYNAVSNNYIEKLPIKITKKLPYYLKTNIKCYCMKVKNKEFYFLPNKVLIEDSRRTLGINFSELLFEFGELECIERQVIPSDSEISGYSYQYVNKNGEPDKRYKNNPKYPKCLYGTIDIKNQDGLNLSLLLSSKNRTIQAKQYYENLKSSDIKTEKYCTNCGEKISVDANFCKFCGTKQ